MKEKIFIVILMQLISVFKTIDINQHSTNHHSFYKKYGETVYDEDEPDFVVPKKKNFTQNQKINPSNPKVKLLLSMNMISNPHFYPDYGLNYKNEDPFGNKFEMKAETNNNSTNTNSFYYPGELSDIGIKQISDLAIKINNYIRSYQSDQIQSLDKDEIITVSIRLKRSIDAARILNERILKENGVKVDQNNKRLVKFDLNYFNFTLNMNDKNETNSTLKSTKKEETLTISNILNKFDHSNNKNQLNKSRNFTNEDMITYIIPSEYEKSIFPLNYNIENCDKLKTIFEKNLNSNTVISLSNQYFKDIISSFKNILSSPNFERIINKNFVNFLNFSEYNLENRFESIKILTDYYLNYEALKDTGMIKSTNSKLADFNNTHIFVFGKYNLFDVKTFDSFFIKNFSDDFIKIYTNGIFKFLLNAIYTKLDSSTTNILSNIKVINLIMHEYNLAGIYSLLNLKLLNIEEENVINFSKYPKIDYGSKLTIDLLLLKEEVVIKNEVDQTAQTRRQDQETGAETDSITDQIFIRISFNDNLTHIMKLPDFIETVSKVLITDENSFFNNLC